MAYLSGLYSRFRKTTFRRQLAILFTIGVLCVSLLAALATSWQGSRQLHADKLQDGLRISQNLAMQSRLALAFGSTENVAEVFATAASPDITRIEIRHTDGQILFEYGTAMATDTPARPPDANARSAYVDEENAAGWRFVAPVWSLSGPDSPFETTERKDVLLGFVVVEQSKATLEALVREVFLVNFAVSIVFAALFAFSLRQLARRLIRPLADLSATMARAGQGESGLRADLTGPRDLADMAHAFNNMMEALEQREQELRTARDSALRFACLKANFAATVSHEIRTPLNGVIGTLDMLKSGRTTPEQAELLGLAWDSAQYLLELINNILDFSRLEAGRMEVDISNFALQPLIDSILGMFTATAAKHLSLETDIAPEVPPVLSGDPARLRQVLINLIGNAVKFTERGSVKLSVTGSYDGQQLRFEVSDTGIGIAADLRSSIFDSFTQADPTTTRRYGGSGLGLAISKQIVGLLGGEIGVDSNPGTGSRFWFTLPWRAGQLNQASRHPTAEKHLGRHARILIAEDNATNQAVAVGMLRRLGCTCGIASNGAEAVARWREEAWDLVLMDCAMPEMDGFQATAAIRREEVDGRHTPIIAMTANTLAADIEHCREAGMDDHMAKPLTLEALTGHLHRWLHYDDAPAVETGDTVGTAVPALSFDGGVMTCLRDCLGEALGEAIRPFLEDMPGYLQEMEEAIAAGNADTLCRLAHVIKGAAGNLGALAMASVARDMEALAESGTHATGNELLLRLRTEFALIEPTLLAELDEPPSLPQPQPQPQDNAAVVLVVDDDRSTRAALRHALHQSGFRVSEASNGTEALAWLEKHPVDAILMDALMPVMDGFATCHAVKAHPEWQGIPVLMITALNDRHSIERAFEAGASDFIPKPIHLSVVNQRVRRIIDATRAERHVHQLAYNDTLTGLPNRLLFVAHLNDAISHCESNAGMLAVLFLDLDRFKFINDTHGHEAGDQLLATMALRLKGCIRTDDCVARLGGDEFTILLNDLPNPGVAAGIAQNICRTIAAPLVVGSQEVVMTASIGISLYPNDGEDVSSLLRHADTAMYRAKHSSGGFCYYETDMESAISDRLKMENDLRRALERDEITVFYQPVVDTVGSRVTGVEALIRWLHPEQGLIPPSDFIPIAEETGLILALGEHVLRCACAQARAWIDNGRSDLCVAVNLSARQLEQPNLRDIVHRALTDSGLPPSALVLEITESVLMARAAANIDLLRDLRQLGIHLSIDDFGTGYSSLSYLKHLPADTLKIDRSFIQDVPADEDAVAIVTGILALAHSLRMKVVAEGVETGTQREMLARLKCDQLQGYLFSKPLPAEVIETQLLTPKRRRRQARKTH
ncbi:MAG: EAL domain-containing protein [Azonexus sp.]|jgi:diguanylate cyclase (GGDEF)-like protein|uniref:EAL domain-containing protein n=1 Tax=Azonexus sp. TaxID=1872668 RepID=UPI002827F8CA|nr:EAL domain-containing protein [Azonexus sp.]MDR0776990.1 EAL domain-containing protein [Azonexus sp.]